MKPSVGEAHRDGLPMSVTFDPSTRKSGTVLEYGWVFRHPALTAEVESRMIRPFSGRNSQAGRTDMHPSQPVIVQEVMR